MNDLGSSLPLCFSLTGNRPPHLFRQIHLFGFNQRNFDPPRFRVLIKNVLELNIDLVPLGEQLVEIGLAEGRGRESVQEDARFVLPNAAETKIVVTMNARELRHFFHVRCCNRAQWEIRDLAWRMRGMVKELAPNLFERTGPSCLYGSCQEGKMTCGKVEEVRKKFGVKKDN